MKLAEIALLYLPFFGWVRGLPQYVRLHDEGSWLEPPYLTWLLTAPFFGFFFFVYLVLRSS